MSAAKPNYPAAILTGGLASGALDIAAVCLLYKTVPARVFKTIAAGWVGREEARAGGAEMVALGAASHFAILLVAAAIYVVASRRLPILVKRPGTAGMIYGLLIYAVMTYVVLPLSAAPRSGAPGMDSLLQTLLIHMILVGLPIAVAARQFARIPSAPAP